jgi:hypothetical protein
MSPVSSVTYVPGLYRPTSYRLIAQGFGGLAALWVAHLLAAIAIRLRDRPT